MANRLMETVDETVIRVCEVIDDLTRSRHPAEIALESIEKWGINIIRGKQGNANDQQKI